MSPVFAILLLSFLATAPHAESELPLVTSGSWVETPRMDSPRSGASARLLMDGRVLVIGGCYTAGPRGSPCLLVTRVEIYDPESGTWNRTQSMNHPRSPFTMTLLQDGRVLVTGGTSAPELFDPVTETWRDTTPMGVPRSGHAAVLLQDGRVLTIGGCHASSCGAPTVTTEVYDPKSETWTQSADLSIARTGYSEALLSDGRVLIAGGAGPRGGDLRSAEIYDPDEDIWTPTGDLITSRGYTILTCLLPSGQLLIVGGSNRTTAVLVDAELYDPKSGEWTATGSMGTGRPSGSGACLKDGRALVAGGFLIGRAPQPTISTAEVYDPENGSWTPTASMSHPRSSFPSTVLDDGRVLVSSGLSFRYCDGGCTFGFQPAGEVYTP